MKDEIKPPHPEGCICESCFEKPWLLEQVRQALVQLDPAEIRQYLAPLEHGAPYPDSPCVQAKPKRKREKVAA